MSPVATIVVCAVLGLVALWAVVVGYLLLPEPAEADAATSMSPTTPARTVWPYTCVRAAPVDATAPSRCTFITEHGPPGSECGFIWDVRVACGDLRTGPRLLHEVAAPGDVVDAGVGMKWKSKATFDADSVDMPYDPTWGDHPHGGVRAMAVRALRPVIKPPKSQNCVRVRSGAAVTRRNTRATGTQDPPAFPVDPLFPSDVNVAHVPYMAGDNCWIEYARDCPEVDRQPWEREVQVAACGGVATYTAFRGGGRNVPTCGRPDACVLVAAKVPEVPPLPARVQAMVDALSAGARSQPPTAVGAAAAAAATQAGPGGDADADAGAGAAASGTATVAAAPVSAPEMLHCVHAGSADGGGGPWVPGRRCFVKVQALGIEREPAAALPPLQERLASLAAASREEQSRACAALFDVDVFCNGVLNTMRLEPGSGRAVDGGSVCGSPGDCTIVGLRARRMRPPPPLPPHGIRAVPNRGVVGPFFDFHPGDGCALERAKACPAHLRPRGAAALLAGDGAGDGGPECQDMLVKMTCGGEDIEVLERARMGSRRIYTRGKDCDRPGDCRLLGVRPPPATTQG